MQNGFNSLHRTTRLTEAPSTTNICGWCSNGSSFSSALRMLTPFLTAAICSNANILAAAVVFSLVRNHNIIKQKAKLNVYSRTIL